MIHRLFTILYGICKTDGELDLDKKISCNPTLKAKQKYRGMFETQKSGNKTSLGEIGLDITTHASPKAGQDQVSGGVNVLC